MTNSNNNLSTVDASEWINKIRFGDVVDVLPQMPDNAVNCIVTSPPYY